MEDARPAHDGVVDVEERGGVRIGCDRGIRCHGSGRSSGLAGAAVGGQYRGLLAHRSRVRRVAGPIGQTRGVADPRVVLVGKPDCHLCEDAQVIVERVCGDAGIDWEERSVLDDPALADEYWEHIPVVLVDGEVFSRWFVQESDLRARLVDR